MASEPAGVVLRHLRKLTAAAANGLPDRALLERFLDHDDETAFEALVRRHGPLVLSVCWSVLHNRHDAEDVFQATFLVLARKAASIRRQNSLGSWLHGVAYRLAQKVRTSSARRRRREQEAAAPAAPDAPDDLTWGELRGILHEEVQRLPEKHRAPLLLCYWEGQTQDEAARQLGLARGTLKDRLERARQVLHNRLLRRGVSLSVALLALLLSGSASALPAAGAKVLAQAVLHAGPAGTVGGLSAGAIALAHGALQLASLTKLKVGLFLLMIGTMAAGVVKTVERALVVKTASTRPARGPETPPAAPNPPAPPRQHSLLPHRAPPPSGAIARPGTARPEWEQKAQARWERLAVPRETPSPEVRDWVGHLAEQLRDWSPQHVQAYWTVRMLERSGTPEAMEQLQALAQGTPNAPLTRAAQQSLRRLAIDPMMS